ncbi:MAG TPA: transposase [Candidatus Polarisedimenticolia bacterium]|nr:transposase [Candidatus Polarisedimenticolia bacterium]
MARPGPKKTQRYGVAFKRTAVQLSRRPGLQVQAIAEALDIHPFMLSRWRKEFREGRLRVPRPTQPRQRVSKAPLEREIRRLQELERAHQLLQEEHALLKKAIRFCSARKPKSSRSSTGTKRR